jgi:AbrB family looped-hinge helix DNA binding protein
MKRATSRLTAQGQVSVPAEVRRHLGLAAGSFIEWDLEGTTAVVRRAAKISSEEIHRVLFASAPRARTLVELKAGIRKHVRGKHARG